MDPLVVIYGSTGTGKSDLAVELATRFNGEIINADAMQMYRGLPIITNQLTDKEQRGIPHHLLGNIGLESDPWTVQNFKPKAIQIISEIRARGKLPIVVGGTSYYLNGLLFEESVLGSEKTSENLDEVEKKHPILLESAEVMLAKLREVDPVMAGKWHPNDVRKIRNSLAVYLQTGRRTSDIYAEQQSRKESTWACSDSATTATTTVGRPLIFWLYAMPEMLNPRLEKRVDRMLDNGLVREVTEAYEHLQARVAAGEQVDRSKGIWQSIGFKQFEPYLCALRQHENAKPDMPGPTAQQLQKLKKDGIDQTKTANRQYAKYQVRFIALKTIPLLEKEKLLDRFFLLDSSDIEHYRTEVLEKGGELTQKFLTDPASLPQPQETSETAREVLAFQAARREQLAADVACNRRCEVCDKWFVTEQTWEKHMRSNKHRAVVNRKKKKALTVLPNDADVNKRKSNRLTEEVVESGVTTPSSVPAPPPAATSPI